MSNSAILRRITIDLIINNYNPIIEWFDKYWEELRVFKTNVSDGSVFYYKPSNSDDDIFPYRTIFYLNSNNNNFYCDNIYWAELGEELKGSYTEIQLVTKFLVENKLGIELPIPNCCLPHDTDIVLNVFLK